MRWGTIGAGLAWGLLAAHPAFSQQDEPANRYEMLYGTPVDVSLSDLVQNPMAYSNRAVRTTGRLEMSPQIQQHRTYMLADSAVDVALLQPVPEIGEIGRASCRERVWSSVVAGGGERTGR